ncbi:hypothetical protein Q7P37_010607 [Cladosporium fusiforme]
MQAGRVKKGSRRMGRRVEGRGSSEGRDVQVVKRMEEREDSRPRHRAQRMDGGVQKPWALRRHARDLFGDDGNALQQSILCLWYSWHIWRSSPLSAPLSCISGLLCARIAARLAYFLRCRPSACPAANGNGRGAGINKLLGVFSLFFRHGPSPEPDFEGGPRSKRCKSGRTPAIVSTTAASICHASHARRSSLTPSLSSRRPAPPCPGRVGKRATLFCANASTAVPPNLSAGSLPMVTRFVPVLRLQARSKVHTRLTPTAPRSARQKVKGHK